MGRRHLPISKSNHFIYFIMKLALFLSVIFILDLVIGSLLNHFYFLQHSGDQFRTTYSIEKTTAEIIILGSSRACHHYNPAIFEKKLNLSAYNAGRDGNFIFYHYAVLKGILSRYTPKIVILDINRAEFQVGTESYDRIASLLPYYKKHPEIRSIVELKSPYEKIKLLSKIYPFNSSIFTIAIGNLEINKSRRIDFQGYLPIYNIYYGLKEKETLLTEQKLDSIKVETYKSIISECKRKGVKLFVICSPYYIDFRTNDKSILLAEEIALQNGVEFYNFSDNPIFSKNKMLFGDKSHLNDQGANTLSNMVIDSILNVTSKLKSFN